MRIQAILSTLLLTGAMTSSVAMAQTLAVNAAPGATQDDLESRPAVPNYDAKTGDVTVCPYTGKKFEVKADSPRIEWKGKSWVFCCSDCLPDVQADPEKYLGKYLPPDSGKTDKGKTDKDKADKTEKKTKEKKKEKTTDPSTGTETTEKTKTTEKKKKEKDK